LRIGHARAFELFAFGEPLAAHTAVAWGIANKVTSLANLPAEAQRIAEKIAAKPPGSLTAMKRLMRDAERLVAQMDSETTIFTERLASAEAKEAFTAFAQKRQPDFTKIVRQ
jgi:enoyl-CoA hydratase/carnithine racemase